MFSVKPNTTIRPINVKAPNIFIEPDAYMTITEYVKQCQYEISWFSRVEELSEKEFVITDAILLNQTVTHSSAEFSEEELSTFMSDILKTHGIDSYNKIKCWGHSHVNFDAVPSGQDLKQIRQFNEQDYYIMLIVNKKGDAHVAFYDFKNNVVYENIPVHLYSSNSREISKQVQQSIEEKVKLPRVASPAKYKQVSMTFDKGSAAYYNAVDELNVAAQRIYGFFKAAGDATPYDLTIEALDNSDTNKGANLIASRMDLVKGKQWNDVLPRLHSACRAKQTLGMYVDIEACEEWKLLRYEALTYFIRQDVSVLKNMLAFFEKIYDVINERGWDIIDLLSEEIAVNDTISLNDIRRWCKENDVEDSKNIIKTIERLQENVILSYDEIICELYEYWLEEQDDLTEFEEV